MVRLSKKAVVRLPPIRNPRRQLPFRFYSYNDLIADLGRTDALASSLTLSVRYFSAAAEAFAKDVEEKRKEKHQIGTVAPTFTGKDQLRAMWEFGNLQAARFAINTKNPEFPVLATHTIQLLLVGVYQQAEAFLNGVREELREMGHRWPQRGNHVPLLEYTLQNLPGGHSHNRVKIGTERYDLFEYYRLMRNAFVHRPIDHGKLAGYFDGIKEYRKTVASEYGLDAPNQFGRISMDDYHLFTRLVKYIATDICRIGEPSDEALLKRIEWKGDKLEAPLERFVSSRRPKEKLVVLISRWFKEQYGLKFENREEALRILVEYVEKFPNQRLRRKNMKRS